MVRKYDEKDLSFYDEREISTVKLELSNRGKVISWKPLDGVEGYAIYKGSGRTIKVNSQRFIKIVVLSTHNQIHNKDYYVPSRWNVAVSEIEIFKEGLEGNIATKLPVESFSCSSTFDQTSLPQEAFNGEIWEERGKGWQSATLKENPFKQDFLNEWIMIDLGTRMKIKKLRIQNSNDSGGLCGIHEYRIDVSDDGMFWTSIHQGKLNMDGELQEVELLKYFYKTEDVGEGWQLIDTVSSSTLKYLDGEDSAIVNSDYRVTGILTGDISFEGSLDGEVDIRITTEFESATQDITNRLRSQKGQWKNHQEMGANLELLEGMKNTRENAEIGTAMIEEALTNDNRFSIKDLNIRPVPMSITQLDYYVIAETSESENPIVVTQKIEM